MGSLCNFHALKYPHSCKPLSIHSKNQALPNFHSLPNANARFTRTRKHTSCLVVAEIKDNNGRNPEKKQQVGKKNSLNTGNNGFWPKQKTVAQNEWNNKDQNTNAWRDSFSVVIQNWELFTSKFSGVLQKTISSIDNFFQTDFGYIILGFIWLLWTITFVVPWYLFWYTFWFVVVNGLKISAVVAIIGLSYVYLY